jgi:hypothetical protein
MADPKDMAETMKANLQEKTGHDLAYWLQRAAEAGAEKHGQIVRHLKTAHGLTHGYANLVAHEWLAARSGQSDDGDLLAAQYAGARAPLKAVYNAVLAALDDAGVDYLVAPKKTYVSLRRSRQFALVQPSTKTRVDFGLVLKGREPAGRLEASGSFNAMVTHRVRLARSEDVDREVRAWLLDAVRDA